MFEVFPLRKGIVVTKERSAFETVEPMLEYLLENVSLKMVDSWSIASEIFKKFAIFNLDLNPPLLSWEQGKAFLEDHKYIIAELLLRSPCENSENDI